MRINESILDLIGQTPLVRLRTGIPDDGPQVFAKLEFLNPSGSIKDRMAWYIIRKALDDGRIRPGDTIIDNTSGNTGASMAMVAKAFGLEAVVTTPDKTSSEKVNLMRSFGAQVKVTPELFHDHPDSFYSVARKLAREDGCFDLDQYDSQDNVESHYRTTGPEIWDDTEGRITHFVCGIGTGGTFSGAARYLKEQNPDVRAIAVDPEGSMFSDFICDHKEGSGSPYKVEGIGSDVMTEALHLDLIDEIHTISDRDSFLRARLICRQEGISAGGSSGAVAVAMEKVAKGLGPEAVVIGIFADSGAKYMSKMYNDEWMIANGFLKREEVGT
jgi:cystathionine beta-synthase